MKTKQPTKTKTSITKVMPTKVSDLHCHCSGSYTTAPEEDAPDYPPSVEAKLLRCKRCDEVAWVEPYDFQLEDWDDVDEFRQEHLARVARDDEDSYFYM